MSFFDKWDFFRGRPPYGAETDSIRLTNTPPQNKRSIDVIFPRQACPAFCIAACVLLVALTARGGPLLPKHIATDSSVFRYVGKVILSGGMPYRDTFDHKGPLLYLIQTAGLFLGGQGIWVLECLALLITFLYFYKVARLMGNGKKVACASIICGAFMLFACFEGGNLTEEYALPFLSVSLYIFLRYFTEGKASKWHLMVCGASCAAVTLLRVNMVGLWIVMCLGVLANCVLNKRIPELFYDVLWFLLGFLTLTLPVFLWLYRNGALEGFIQDYFLFNFIYTSASTGKAPIKNKLEALYAMTMRPYNLLPASFLFYACAVKKRLPDILCLAAIALDIVLSCISGQTFLHYNMILIPLIVYAFSRVFAEFSEIGTPRQCRMAFLTVVLISLVIMSQAWVGFFVSASDTADFQIAQIVRENSAETDSITVCGNRDSIYLFSDRCSVSKYSYQSPCFITGSEKSAEMQEEYFRDVETLKPKIIVLPHYFQAYERMKAIADKTYRLLDAVYDVEIYSLIE